MRISTTKTQVSRRTIRSHWTAGVLLALLLCLLRSGVPFGQGEPSWRDSLVRVSLKYETSGVLHEGRYLQSKVIEHTDFQGLIVDARGYILSHVGSHWLKLRSPQSRLVVEFSDGQSESARLIGVDERIDVAVVESRRAARREVDLGSSLRQKQLIFVHSSGDGWLESSLCTIGIESNRLLPETTIVARTCQPDPQISPGSGGFVLDGKGRFLGIVTGVESAGVSGSVKAYRVVPTELLNNSLRELVHRRENLQAGYLGVYPDTEGDRVVVTEVGMSTPAAEAGILAGDVVVALDARPIQNLIEFGKILRWKGPGSRLELTVERGGEIVRLHPVLSAYPAKKLIYGWKLELPRVWSDDSGDHQELKLSPIPLPSPLGFGLVVDTLSPQLASYFKVPNGNGLLVTTVMEESLASRSGFQAGDVLIEINGTKLSSPSVMREILQDGRDGVLVVRFVRDGIVQSRKLVFP